MTKTTSFAVRNLNVAAYTNGFTLWHYKIDARHDTIAPGFFDPAADMVSVGDLIVVSGNAGASIVVVAGVGPEKVSIAGLMS